MREITQRMILSSKRYIGKRFGFLEPFELDEEKIAETVSGVYLKCICHFPNCPTMKGEIDPQHPYARVRTSKLNGRTQISCGACAKKARQLDEYKFKKMEVGDIVGCWQLDEALTDKKFKEMMGWTGHGKYYKAHCIYCGLTDYKNSDHLKVGDDSCVCRSGSANEKRINKLLKRILANSHYSHMAEYGLDKQRVDFAILDGDTPVLFIEYDGEFHDKAERNKGELAVNKERDERKDSRAEQLNIPIIRISYKEQNKITEPWLRKEIESRIGVLE